MRKLGLLVVGVVLTLATACDSNRATGVVSANASPRTATPDGAVKSDFYQASGPLVVENQVDVAAQREGVVTKVQVDAGQHVRKGEVLAELDNRELLAERDAAEADVHGNEANLNNWIAEAQVLDSDYKRDQELWKAQLITAQQLEHSRYKVEAAKFQTARFVQNVAFTKAKLRTAELELGKTRIVAPFDGVVARRYVREGQKVSMSERLFWVTATGPMRVNFTLPQEFAGKIKVGDVVKVSPAGSPDQQHDASVSLISPVVDPSSGTIEVRAQLNGTPAGLLPGMTVGVQVAKH